jgi:hypothetical protein
MSATGHIRPGKRERDRGRLDKFNSRLADFRDAKLLVSTEIRGVRAAGERSRPARGSRPVRHEEKLWLQIADEIDERSGAARASERAAWPERESW